ncbi:MAG: preprotein translocase subunit SecG [Rhizobiaceae bacterium]|nr:preprotein translocase subunit SecG [Rhizobiaceae bacterium]MCV0406450.1 preprotein translocase subunit SecG [Rhizobiaceae bacterium]
MQTVLIVIHLLIVLALVGVVLLQRSEGGGLGIGGGSGFMTARGASNALTKTTAILALAFFATSLGLSLLARYGERPTDYLDRIPAAASGEQSPAAPSGSGGVLDQLGGSGADQQQAPAEEPASQAPTAPTGTGAGGDAQLAEPASPGINEPVIVPSEPSEPQAPTGN